MTRSATTVRTPRSRLRPTDLLGLGSAGLVAKPARAILSALGVAVGVAAMVAVLGISSSSQAKLDAQLDALGTNLFSATSAPPVTGEPVPLPGNASARAARLPGVGTTQAGPRKRDGGRRRVHVDPPRGSGEVP